MDKIRIDDLQCKGLVLKQNTDLFCFGTDSVLLAHFFNPAGHKKVCDFGCGSGILSVLIAGNYSDINVHSIEIDTELYSLAYENVLINGLSNMIVYNDDIANAKQTVGICSAVICNPPYEKVRTGILPQNECHRNARYECLIDFNGIAKSASDILEDGGHFYFIHKTARLEEISNVLNRFGLIIKQIRFVFPSVDRQSVVMMVKAVKNANRGLVVMPPLIVYGQDGKYSEEVKSYYDA